MVGGLGGTDVGMVDFSGFADRSVGDTYYTKRLEIGNWFRVERRKVEARRWVIKTLTTYLPIVIFRFT